MFLRIVSNFLLGFGLIIITVQAALNVYLPVLSGEELAVSINLIKQVEIETVSLDLEELCRVRV